MQLPPSCFCRTATLYPEPLQGAGCALFAIGRVLDPRMPGKPHSQEWLCYTNLPAIDFPVPRKPLRLGSGKLVDVNKSKVG